MDDITKIALDIANRCNALLREHGGMTGLKFAEIGGMATDISMLSMHQGEALNTARQRIAELEAAKDGAYSERNHVVALLARIYPSSVGRTDIPGWDDDWHGCVTINLPTGQISYHFHDSEAPLFDGLPRFNAEWDGHDKATVHARLLEEAALKESANG